MIVVGQRARRSRSPNRSAHHGRSPARSADRAAARTLAPNNRSELSVTVLDLVEGDEGRALDVLEERPAAGGDVRYLLGEAKLLDCLGRFAAADDGHTVRASQCLGDCARALAVRLVLELAHRPVPDDRLRLRDLRLEALNRLRADVHA